MLQSLHLTTKDVEHFDWFLFLAQLEEIRVFCFSGTEFLYMQIKLFFHGQESTSHNIIYSIY